MPKHFFHLAIQIPARDLLGHECADDTKAQDRGIFIDHRNRTEKPEMIREGNSIAATDALDMDILRSPLAPTEA